MSKLCKNLNSDFLHIITFKYVTIFTLPTIQNQSIPSLQLLLEFLLRLFTNLIRFLQPCQ